MLGPNQLASLEMPPTLAKQMPDPGVGNGEVFTRRWVVELILDLVGYTADKDLAAQVIVEPSCGTGAFLLPILERLLESSSRHGHELSSLGNAILALDLLNSNAERALKAVALRLQEAGLDQDKSVELAASWVSTGISCFRDTGWDVRIMLSETLRTWRFAFKARPIFRRWSDGQKRPLRSLMQ